MISAWPSLQATNVSKIINLLKTNQRAREKKLFSTFTASDVDQLIYLHHFEDEDLPSGTRCEGVHLEQVGVPGQIHA